MNRVFFPYTMSACMLLDMGANPYLVDKAIAGGFGMPMGPFRCAFVWVCTYWAFSLVSADAALHGANPYLPSPTPPSAGYPALTLTYIPLLNFQTPHTG